jgi:phage tail-like protein
MPNGQRVDPALNSSFIVELDGIARAQFSEVSGLDATIEPVEHREGGDITTARKLPGLNSYSNISLKWGLTDDVELYTWHRNAVLGNVERKNGSIVLLDRQRNEVARWNFREGWPTKYEAPSTNATANEVAIETLEIVHEGLERV